MKYEIHAYCLEDTENLARLAEERDVEEDTAMKNTPNSQERIAAFRDWSTRASSNPNQTAQ